jgi:protein-S-isoprenylcysteine O-methyltransferase Ste14
LSQRTLSSITLSQVYKWLAVVVIVIGVLATLFRDSTLVARTVTGEGILVVMLLLLLAMLGAFTLDTFTDDKP